MKFIDGNIEIEVKRNPNTIVLYIDKKEQRRETITLRQLIPIKSPS